jgi:hypothetical protein
VASGIIAAGILMHRQDKIRQKEVQMAIAANE